MATMIRNEDLGLAKIKGALQRRYAAMCLKAARKSPREGIPAGSQRSGPFGLSIKNLDGLDGLIVTSLG